MAIELVALFDQRMEDTFGFFLLNGGLYGAGMKWTIYKVIPASYGYSVEPFIQLPKTDYLFAISCGDLAICEREFWSPQKGHFFTWPTSRNSLSASKGRISIFSFSEESRYSSILLSSGGGFEVIAELPSRYSFVRNSDFLVEHASKEHYEICRLDGFSLSAVARIPSRDCLIVNSIYCGDLFFVYEDGFVTRIDGNGFVEDIKLKDYLPKSKGDYTLGACGNAGESSAYFCLGASFSKEIYILVYDSITKQFELLGPLAKDIGSFLDFAFLGEYIFTTVHHRITAYDRTTCAVRWEAPRQSRFCKFFSVVSEKDILVTGISSGAHMSHLIVT